METQEYRADLKTLPESGPNPLPALSPGPGSVHLSAAISVQLCMAGNSMLALDQTSVEEVVQAAAQGVADARGCTEPRMPLEELGPRFLEAPDVGRSAVSDDG